MKAACAALLAATLFATQAVADDEEMIDKRLAADPAGEVEVSNVAGSVNVSGWDRAEVHVSGELGSGVERLVFESSGKRTVVKVMLKKGYHRGGNGETDLNIRVPKGSRLDVNTVSAEITAQDVTGAQRLQSVSGDISTETSAEADLKTVSGTISLRGNGQSSQLDLTTVSGDAVVTRIAGEVTVSTVSGSLELTLDKLTRAKLRTTSGDLSVSARLDPNARIDAETISGQLTLDFKGGVDAQIEAESFSGDIESCSGPKAKSTQEYGPGSELRYTEGKGTGRISVSSLSGDINLCTR